MCVTSTAGIALAGNLFTFFIFYEMLTLATYPPVVHRDTPEAIAAGRKYLAYTLIGGQVLLAGIVALYVTEGPLEFAAGGAVSGETGRGILILIFALLIGGLGVKAALVPLHGWLPSAMVAPTPVSALLHGVAVVKAGAFGILRVIYEVYGVELCRDLGVLLPLSLVASFTIIYASLRALSQNELKKMLAYSTVSQVSYIILGASLLGFLDSVGALVHLVHQGIMKVTLFFCAGLLAETLGIRNINKMDGVARRMPWTMAAFSLAAFGMIGLPPPRRFREQVVSRGRRRAGGTGLGRGGAGPEHRLERRVLPSGRLQGVVQASAGGVGGEASQGTLRGRLAPPVPDAGARRPGPRRGPLCRPGDKPSIVGEARGFEGVGS